MTSLLEVSCRTEVNKTERSVYINHIKISEIRKKRMKRWKIGKRSKQTCGFVVKNSEY